MIYIEQTNWNLQVKLKKIISDCELGSPVILIKDHRDIEVDGFKYLGAYIDVVEFKFTAKTQSDSNQNELYKLQPQNIKNGGKNKLGRENNNECEKYYC